MTEPVPTTNCLRCSTGLVYIMHTQGCKNNPNYDAEATAQSIKRAAKIEKKRADDLAAKRAAIDITTLTYLITDGDVGEVKNGSYDKILTVQIIDGGGGIVGTWSIYFYFSSGFGWGKGEERRIFNTAHLGHNIRIKEAYQKLGLSRFMGKILAEKIEGMIEAKKLREDDLFYIEADATGRFWENMGMTTVLSERGAPDSRFGWDPDPDSGDKYMYVGEFISWANGTQKGTKPESKARLDELISIINKYTGKKSSFGGGRKKRTRKKRTRKRRKTRKKSKKKRKRKTRKNKQFLYNPNNPKKII